METGHPSTRLVETGLYALTTYDGRAFAYAGPSLKLASSGHFTLFSFILTLMVGLTWLRALQREAAVILILARQPGKIIVDSVCDIAIVLL